MTRTSTVSAMSSEPQCLQMRSTSGGLACTMITCLALHPHMNGLKPHHSFKCCEMAAL